MVSYGYQPPPWVVFLLHSAAVNLTLPEHPRGSRRASVRSVPKTQWSQWAMGKHHQRVEGGLMSIHLCSEAGWRLPLIICPRKCHIWEPTDVLSFLPASCQGFLRVTMPILVSYRCIGYQSVCSFQAMGTMIKLRNKTPLTLRKGQRVEKEER